MDPTPIQEHRSRLLALAGEPDTYPFLSVVDRYLAIVPLDAQIRAMALSLLVGKGLHRVAAELAQACPAESPSAGELHKAAAGLRLMRSELIPLDSTRDCFEKNLRVLRTLGRESAALTCQLEEVWSGLTANLSLHRANDGNVLARFDLPGAGRTWVPAALDFDNRVEQLVSPESLKGSLLSPLLFENVGMGLLVPRVHTATHRAYLTHSPPIFVVETDLRALALALHLQDWSEVLADERTFLLAGPRAWEDWFELMCEQVELAEPREAVPLPRWPDRPESNAEATLKRVCQYRETLFSEQQARVRALYRGQDAGYWARRFTTAGPHEPLRILAVTSRFTTFLQHSTKDLMDAFERTGCQTRILIEEKDYGRLPAHGYMQAVAEFRPDLLVVLDHHRHEYGNRIASDVPFVCWIQDELMHLLSAETGRRLGPLDFTIGFGMERCVLQYEYPADRFMPCKLAINPAKFAPLPGSPDDPSLACDLAYVSHHSETPDALHARVRGMVENPIRQRFMDAFYEEMRPLMTSGRFNAGYDLDRMLSDVERKLGTPWGTDDEREKLMTVYIRPLVDRTLRHTTLEWAANWVEATGRKMSLYGRGWDQHPKFAHYARGEAGHGGHLAQIARQAAINLHMGLNPALHQRVLETVSAGGFLLVRYCPFDFHEPAVDILFDFLRNKGITEPIRLRLEELPESYLAARRRTASRMNRPVGDHVDITKEDLLRRSGHAEDRRYEYASLAFPGFDQLTFDSRERFAERAEHYVTRCEERRSINAQMARVVQDLFTYDALVVRLIGFLTHRLQQTAAIQEMAVVSA